MYKKLTKQDFLNAFKLPDDYTIDSFVVYGTYKDELPGFLSVLENTLGIKVEISNFQSNFLRPVTSLKVNDKIIWFANAYGGTLLSEWLHIACLFGCKQTIQIGSCGGLLDDVSSGDIIIPDSSYGNESSTRLYSEDRNTNFTYYPNKTLVQRAKMLLESQHKVWIAPTTTCQAMLAESQEDIDNWRKDAYAAVEMEASTVFAVSNFFKVPAVSILFVGDNLVKEESVLSDSYQAASDKRKEAQRDIFACVSELVK